MDLYKLIEHKLRVQSSGVIDQSNKTVEQILTFIKQVEFLFSPKSFELSLEKTSKLNDEWLSLMLDGNDVGTLIQVFTKAADSYQILSYNLFEELKSVFSNTSLSLTPLTDILKGGIDYNGIESLNSEDYPLSVKSNLNSDNVIPIFKKEVKYFEDSKIDLQEEYACQTIDELLEEHTKIQIICIDIEFKNHLNLSYSDFVQGIFYRFPELIDTLIATDDHILEILTNVLPNNSFSLILQCVFILKVNRVKIKEASFRADLEYRITQNGMFGLNFTFKIHDWNAVIRENYSQKAIGVISASDSVAIAECKYWVVSPIYSINQIVQFKFQNSDQCYFNLRTSKRMKILDFRSIERLNNEAIQKFKKINLNNLSKLPSKNLEHLNLERKNHLKIAKLIYDDYDARSSHAINLLKGKLYQIEVFLETLNSLQTVRLVRLPAQPVPEHFFGEALIEHLTNLGKLWCEVMDSLQSRENEFIESSLPVASINLRIFQKFFKEKREEIMHLHMQTGKSMIELQTLLQQDLKSRIIKEGMIEYKEAKFVKRLQSHTSDLEKDLEGRTVVYRCQFSSKSESKKITQSELSKLFTKLKKYGKHAKPLFWLKGHIIRWDQRTFQKDQRVDYGDVFLIFDINDKNLGLDMMSLLTTYLDKEKSPFKNIKFEEQPIWLSIPNLNSSELEVKNIKVKIFLLEQFLPCFEYLDYFIETNANPKKRVTNGTAECNRGLYSSVKAKKNLKVISIDMEPSNTIKNLC